LIAEAKTMSLLSAENNLSDFKARQLERDGDQGQAPVEQNFFPILYTSCGCTFLARKV
jgi:hypothetical protein